MQSEKFNGLDGPNLLGQLKIFKNRYKADFLQSCSHKAARKMVIAICKFYLRV